MDVRGGTNESENKGKMVGWEKKQVMLLKLVPKKHNRSALAFVAVGHRSVG